MNSKLFVLAIMTAMPFRALADTEVDRLIRDFDANGDRMLDEGELKNYFARKTFKQFNSWDDKTITKEEVEADADKKAKAIVGDYVGKKVDRSGLLHSVGVEGDPAKRDPLQFFQKYVRLQNSFLSKSDAPSDPAKLAWTVARHDTTYNFDGALSYIGNGTSLFQHDSPDGKILTALFWTPTVEAHVSTAAGSDRDSVSAGIPIDLIRTYLDTNRIISDHNFTLTPMWESDSEFQVQTFVVRPTYTPTIPILWMGVGGPKGSDSSFDFTWRPYAGLEVGRVLDDDAKAVFQGEKTFLRLFFEAKAQLTFNERFAIVGRIVYRRVIEPESDDFLFGEISPTLFLDDAQHFSIGVTLKTGKEPPKFKDVHSANLWMGLKF